MSAATCDCSGVIDDVLALLGPLRWVSGPVTARRFGSWPVRPLHVGQHVKPCVDIDFRGTVEVLTDEKDGGVAWAWKADDHAPVVTEMPDTQVIDDFAGQAVLHSTAALTAEPVKPVAVGFFNAASQALSLRFCLTGHRYGNGHSISVP